MECLFSSEMPIVITTTAREAVGMYSIRELRAIAPTMTIKPAYKLDKGVWAPLLVLSCDRVREPDAAMPENRLQAMFAIPTLSISWFPSMRAPSRAASDFPIEFPSRTQSKAIAIAGGRSMLMVSKLSEGRLKPHSERSITGSSLT